MKSNVFVGFENFSSPQKLGEGHDWLSTRNGWNEHYKINGKFLEKLPLGLGLLSIIIK